MTPLEKVYMMELEASVEALQAEVDKVMIAMSVAVTGNYPRESTEGTMNKALELCEHGKRFEDDCIDCMKQHLEEIIR